MDEDDATADSGQWSDDIARIFHAASGLSEQERRTLLDSECGTDSRIRAEIDRLLFYHDRPGLLDNPVFAGKGRRDLPLIEGQVLAGRFRIARLIGKGGMGTVYEAEDLEGGETVALKTINTGSAAVNRFAERLRKELRIARTVSHPNVCRVHDYWESDSPDGRVTFFTMKLLQGETLAQRIRSKGRIPANAAIKILREVAAGLTEVHRAGIIHRDLKPANIILARDANGEEHAVVMDFGLARDLAAGATETGTAMGTPSYMAPERFEGGKAGIASDVFAFGVVAFETVTGVNHPLVSPRSLVPGLNEAWDRTLLQCFARDPAARPASVEEAVAMLERAAFPWKRFAVLAAAMLLVGAAVFLALTPWGQASNAQGATQITFDSGFTADPSSSADGKLLVYASDRGDRGDLNIWSQRMDTGETAQLTSEPGDEDEPAISPDGKLLAYRMGSNNALFVKTIPNGAPTRIDTWTEAPRFSPDGRTLAYWSGHTSSLGQIWLAEMNGGKPRRIANDFADARFPAWSPDGKAILFRGSRSAYPSIEKNQEWWIADREGKSYAATGAARKLSQTGVVPHDSPVAWDGRRVVFSAANGDSRNLWRLDLFSVMQYVWANPEVITNGAGFQLLPAMISGGRIAYADWRREIHIWKINPANGEAVQITTRNSRDAAVSASSDGRFLAFARLRGPSREVWIRDMQDGSEWQLEAEGRANVVMEPSGKAVALSENRNLSIVQLATRHRTALGEDCSNVLDWTADGARLLCSETSASGMETLKAIDTKSLARTTLLEGRGIHHASFSPDGRQIAFDMRTDSTHSVVMSAFIGSAGRVSSWKTVTSSENWSERPVWSEDGKTLYVVTDRDGFWCVYSLPIDTASLNASGPAKALRHFHSATTTLSHLVDDSSGMSRGGGSIFLSVGSEHSNIWAIRR